jgi:tetratricopeptide (TPR) repeat protein
MRRLIADFRLSSLLFGVAAALTAPNSLGAGYSDGLEGVRTFSQEPRAKHSGMLESDCTRGGSGRAAAFHNRGLAYIAKGDLDRGLADLSEAIRIDPKPAHRYQERGELHERRGDLDRALSDLNEAIRRDPTRAFRFQTRANIFRAKGDLVRAIADWDEAIRLDRSRERSDISIAQTHCVMPVNQKALADYETVLSLDLTIHSLSSARQAYAKLGDTARAEADFETALRLDPSICGSARDVEEARSVSGLNALRDPPGARSNSRDSAARAADGLRRHVDLPRRA